MLRGMRSTTVRGLGKAENERLSSIIRQTINTENDLLEWLDGMLGEGKRTGPNN